jgi:hypothetical protein
MAAERAQSVHSAYSSDLTGSVCAQSVGGFGNDRLLKGLGPHIAQMEPTMINLKVLSTVAAIALVVPMVSAAQAQDRGGMPGSGGARAGGGGGGAAIGGGGGFRGGGGGGPAMGGGGGGFRSGAVAAPGIGSAPSGMRPAPSMGFRPTPGSGGPSVVARGSEANRYVAGGGYVGQGNPGGWNGGYRHYHRHGGGFWPGVGIGIGLGSAYSYYDNNPYYYDDSYGYYDDSTVAAAPPSDDDAVAYCTRRYRSYDPASGTYLGNDGQRHPCPAQ